MEIPWRRHGEAWELGCAGDFNTQCAQTRLQPVAESPGLSTGTFDVPAGSYRYKVAIDESFEENYGAGGVRGGADIPLTAPGGPVTFTYDDTTRRITDSTAVDPGPGPGDGTGSRVVTLVGLLQSEVG